MKSSFIICVCCGILFLFSIASSQSRYGAELEIRSVNGTGTYCVYITIQAVGMAFSGNIHTDKVYSNIYDSGVKEKSITLIDTSVTNSDQWCEIEHIGDGSPLGLKPWLGYALYKITLREEDLSEEYSFYIDYLDSNYPYLNNRDIQLYFDYDSLGDEVYMKRQTDQGMVLFADDIVNGSIYKIWEIFDQAEEDSFFVRSQVPLKNGGKTSDTLYNSICVDSVRLDVPEDSSFVIKPSLYPDYSDYPNIEVRFDTLLGMRIDGTFIAEGIDNNNKVKFTRMSGIQNWHNIYVYSSSNSFKYCTFEYGNWALKIEGLGGSYETDNVVENCEFHDNDQALRIQ